MCLSSGSMMRMTLSHGHTKVTATTSESQNYLNIYKIGVVKAMFIRVFNSGGHFEWH